MNPTQKLHDAGQSLWLDNITRELLDSGTLERYITELSVTGLTSNPSIFDKAVSDTNDYDADIAELRGQGLEGEELFFRLAIDDLRRAADLFAPVHERTDGIDGFVSLEVSPLLAYDTEATATAAARLHGQAERSNLFIKIPGTPEGLPAIERSIEAGVPINVTLLFSRAQYEAQAEAYVRGVERRVEQGLNPAVGSVASIFVSRWDVAADEEIDDPDLKSKLGIAACEDAYRAYRELYGSERWQRLANEGARPQRLLFASTSTKDPSLPDTLYVESLAAPFTVNTMPEKTLLAFADHGEVSGVLDPAGGDSAEVLAAFEDAGVGVDALGERLQKEGADAFVSSWKDLISCIEERSAAVGAAG